MARQQAPGLLGIHINLPATLPPEVVPALGGAPLPAGITDKEREVYYRAVAEAVERCAQMPFTESMGHAVAGHLYRVNFQDQRNTKRAGLTWPTEKS